MLQKKILFIAGAFIILILCSSTQFSSVPPSGYTGVNGYTCANCHAGFPVNSAGGGVTVTGLPTGSYVPGQSYPISVTISHGASNRARWGFALAAKNAIGQAAGETLHELAWGRDYREVIPEDVDKSISAAETFAQDLDNPEEILQEFLRLTQKATARLRDKELFAKTISIKVRFADFTTINRSKTLPLATDSAHETYEVVKDLYKALRIDRARLRLVGVSLENLVDAAPEQMVLGARDKGWRDAERAIDRARARFGRSSVRPGRLVDPTLEDE